MDIMATQINSAGPTTLTYLKLLTYQQCFSINGFVLTDNIDTFLWNRSYFNKSYLELGNLRPFIKQ